MVPTATGLEVDQVHVLRLSGAEIQNSLQDARPLIEISHLNDLEADWILGRCNISPH